MSTFPTDPNENKKARLKFLQASESGQGSQKVKAMLFRKCKEDPIFFCNFFCWTLDPRLANPHLPFILYPRQAELFKQLDGYLARSQQGEQIALFIDKPRDVGATFTVMTWILHKFLFTEFSARVGSRKEDYVDKKGDTDTLFYKLDYQLDKLPVWMTQGFNAQEHRASMILKHSKNNNVVSGESANPNFGRGGRRSVILFDEIGFWDWARSSWESAGSSTNFRIAMTTPPETGRDSFSYKLASGHKGKIYSFMFDWDDVPSRDKAWLDMARENKSDEEFSREVMKSYDGSTEGKVYARDMRFVKLSDVDYDPRLPLFVAMDFGLDAVSMIWYQRDNATRKLKVIDYYQNSNQDIHFFPPFVGHPVKSTYEYNHYDLEVIERHKSWRRDIIYYGDPSVKQRHLSTGKSTRDILQEEYQIYIQSKDWAGRKWTDLRNITRQSFRRMEINEKRCEMLIYALRNARYPKKKEGSQAVMEPLRPIHDFSTSHARSAWEYACDNEEENYFMDTKEELEEDNNFDKFAIF